MQFNSFQFLVFFPVVLAVYFVVPKKCRYLWLLAASYYFYMCWNARYALLLLFSLLTDRRKIGIATLINLFLFGYVAEFSLGCLRRWFPELSMGGRFFMLILGIVMMVVGWRYTSTIGSRGTYISMPNVSKFWMYFPIPLAGFFMIVFELEAIVNDLRAFWRKDTEYDLKNQAERMIKEAQS